MAAHNYTQQQIDWLREHRPKMAQQELATAFNALFGTTLSGDNLKRACLRNGIRSANNGRFVAGHTSWNDGVKGIRHSVATEFKKGHIPKSHLPVGSEIMKDDDYLWVKIAEPNVWRQKHRLIWEAKNGPQPKGTAIIFLDSNRENFSDDNLQLVTRRELLQLNRNKYSQTHPDLKPTVLAVSKLETAVFAAQTRDKPSSPTSAGI